MSYCRWICCLALCLLLTLHGLAERVKDGSGHFSVEVPKGWSAKPSDDTLVVFSRGEECTLVITAQPDAKPDGVERRKLFTSAVKALDAQAEKVSIGNEKEVKIGSHRAFRHKLSATLKGGKTLDGFFMIVEGAKKNHYFVVVQADEDEDKLEAQAESALQSLKEL